eukprot:COSAG06_NODE_3860_length_4823_cov_4.086367_6_plen_81_part_00
MPSYCRTCERSALLPYSDFLAHRLSIQPPVSSFHFLACSWPPMHVAKNSSCISDSDWYGTVSYGMVRYGAQGVGDRDYPL